MSASAALPSLAAMLTAAVPSSLDLSAVDLSAAAEAASVVGQNLDVTGPGALAAAAALSASLDSLGPLTKDLLSQTAAAAASASAAASMAATAAAPEIASRAQALSDATADALAQTPLPSAAAAAAAATVDAATSFDAAVAAAAPEAMAMLPGPLTPSITVASLTSVAPVVALVSAVSWQMRRKRAAAFAAKVLRRDEVTFKF
jgi:hypothetical protein